MGIVAWLILGLVIGIFVHALDAGSARKGFLSSCILSIIGAIAGGLAGSAFMHIDAVAGFHIVTVIIAIFGSLLLLSIGKGYSNGLDDFT